MTKNNRERGHDRFTGGEFSKRVSHSGLLAGEDSDTWVLSLLGPGWIPLAREA